MFAARYRGIFAGVVLGSVSVLLTYHLGNLFRWDENFVVRALKAVAFALVVPGFLTGLVSGNVHRFGASTMAAINFLFWFGFAWLFATFISKLIKLRRAIAAAGVPGDRSSSLGSG